MLGHSGGAKVISEYSHDQPACSKIFDNIIIISAALCRAMTSEVAIGYEGKKMKTEERPK